MTYAPDPRADGISTNDYVALLPRRRFSHLSQGLNLLLPSSGLVVVPFAKHPGGWDVVVVDGHGSYPVGGYHLSVGDGEIETAIELSLGDEVPVELVATPEEAEALDDGTRVLTRTHGSLTKGTVDGETRWLRHLMTKLSLTTAELADDLPAVVSRKRPAEVKATPVSRPRLVYTPEEADALPNGESVLTPGGIVFRKRVGHFADDDISWHWIMNEPLTRLDPDFHFPAKVLGTTEADAPDWNEASRV